MKMIYIASPYSLGDKETNVRCQIDVADVLMDLGYCPIVPLLSHYQHAIRPRPYGDWMEQDIEKLGWCDALLRLSGASKGADDEVAVARSFGIPVYYSVKKLMEGEK